MKPPIRLSMLRVALVVFLVGGLSLPAIQISHADIVVNTVSIILGRPGTTAVGVNGSITIQYGIVANPPNPPYPDTEPGCNASDGTPPTMTFIDLPPGISVSPSSYLFTSCITATDTSAGKGFIFTANAAPGSYTIRVNISDPGPGQYQTDPAKLTLVVDGTVPVITPQVTGPLGANGWYTGDVAVNWSASDPESNVADTYPFGCDPMTITSDTPGQVLSCTKKSAGGVISQTVTIKRDTTPPTNIVGVPDRAPDSNGWYNHPVTIHFTGTDQTSGIASCSSVTYSGPDTSSTTISGSCTDNAGYTTSGAFSLQYDATAPTAVTGAVGRGTDYNGWYNQPVPVTFTGTDALSGIASCTSITYTGPDSAAASVSGSCTDAAGNTTVGSPVTFAYDATAPVLNPQVSPSPVLLHGAGTATAGATDPVSGVASQSCGAVDPSTVGSKSLTCTATDNAGNTVNVPVSYSVQYASSGTCGGDSGHAVLQPVNVDGSSVFQQRRTVPAKFRVCDANGAVIGAPGVVSSFLLFQRVSGTVVNYVNEAVDSSTPDTVFRWDSTAQQWIYNISTQNLSADTTYYYRIGLNDGTAIEFHYGLK